MKQKFGPPDIERPVCLSFLFKKGQKGTVTQETVVGIPFTLRKCVTSQVDHVCILSLVVGQHENWQGSVPLKEWASPIGDVRPIKFNKNDTVRIILQFDEALDSDVDIAFLGRRS